MGQAGGQSFAKREGCDEEGEEGGEAAEESAAGMSVLSDDSTERILALSARFQSPGEEGGLQPRVLLAQRLVDGGLACAEENVFRILAKANELLARI